ncbi:metaxin-1-like [Liolophura sinensis]|uniref:metaxin-1-like n=1 Tax=Liolophura sinensis TaxID=3198878 RepID=UPI0031589A10
MADDVIQVDVWKGDWGLPSVDPNCLAVLAYCKFSGVPVKVKKSGNPLWSPTGDFPVLYHREFLETTVPDIFSYLRKQNWGTDFDLTHKQSADVIAFSSMLEEKLLPAVLHSWWMDGKNYVDLTRPWYAKAAPFPLNFYIPGKLQRRAESRIFLAKRTDNLNDADIEGKIYQDAKECLNHLSYKLGDQDFFFGKMPSSLDALVFGYLAPLLKAPFQGSQLQNHLRGCENLTTLCTRVLQRFFPLDPEELEKKRQEEAEAKKQQMESLDFPHRRRNMILAGLFALSAMIGYALLSGLVQIEITDEDSELLNGFDDDSEDHDE